MEAININQLASYILRDMNKELEGYFDADVVFINSGMQSPLDDEFRIAIEALKHDPNSKQNLCVLLETPGGYIETVKRLVDVMRRHYNEVYFVIPNYAYSAGTVLALSGDKIYMDYYSVLGPIDPQVADENGDSLLPGAGYLAKFEELLAKINKSKDQSKCKGELAYLIKRFEPAKLFHIEQAIEHGQALIQEWLPKYKFKDWSVTEGSKTPVTDKTKKQRAHKIAQTLGDAKKWHSHGRGISMNELMSDEIKLMVNDFGADEKLNSMVRNYHGLAVDFATKQRLRGFIHTKIELRRVFNG